MKLMPISLVLLAVTVGAGNLSARDCFPEQSVSYSPDKQYSILWREPKDNEAHHLVVSDGKRKTDFYEFDRHACVCWEPTGEHFALTDYTGSNVSEAYLYSLNGAQKVLDILDIVPPALRELYAKNHHSYIEVLSWTKIGMLVHLWGYGDLSPNGFDETLRCSKGDDHQWHCIEERPTKR